MNINENEILEKFYGKKICTEKLNIEGFSKPLKFDIYDGYAVCDGQDGCHYDMTYPQMKAINDSQELADAVIEYVGDIDTKEDISVIHVLMAFNTLYKDGVEIKPN